MKKILLLILCLAVLGSAGTALAGSRHREKNKIKFYSKNYNSRYYKHKCDKSGKLGYNFNTNNDFMWWCLINGRVDL